MSVRANAETPLDARTARRFGAEGIGLCRTEHMFFDADRIGAMREMIMADDETRTPRRRSPSCCRCSATDFVEIFRIMQGLPVTIRLLDPPLHEFLPKTDAEFEEMARLTGTRRRRRSASARSRCTRPIRCSAIAAAGSASPIPRSTRCRRARSSRPPSR